MQIEFEGLENEVKFLEIENGELFWCGDSLFMKIPFFQNTNSGIDGNAFCLSSPRSGFKENNYEYFFVDTFVARAEYKLVVKR